MPSPERSLPLYLCDGSPVKSVGSECPYTLTLVADIVVLVGKVKVEGQTTQYLCTENAPNGDSLLVLFKCLGSVTPVCTSTERNGKKVSLLQKEV